MWGDAHTRSSPRAAGPDGPAAAPAPPAEDPDDALLARVAAGDVSAWTVIVQRHLSTITGFAWHMLGDAGEAEDVAQEAFVRLMRKADSWQPGGARLSTWLHRVARNLCIDRHRVKRPEFLEDAPPASVAGPGEGAETRRLDTRRAVGRALARLPERQRTALVLVHYQGFTNGEAAALLDVSVHALESLLSRSRRALRAELEPVVGDLLESRR